MLLCLTSYKGRSQTSSTTPYHPPSAYKMEWQRLHLQLSSTYFTVARENQVDFDSSLLYVSQSLGLSRMAVIAEGINVQGLPVSWVDEKNPGRAVDLLVRVTGKKHLELLILLGAYYAFQPYYNHQYKDSAEYFLKMAINESKTPEENRLGRIARCLLGKKYLQGADLSIGDSVFNRLINDCKIAGDRETEARAFAYRAIYTALSPASVPNQISYLLKARDIYRELKDHENQINVLTDIGYLYVVIFQLQNAQQVFTEALTLADSIGFPYTQYNTDALAMSLDFQSKFGEALRYSIEAIRIAESNRDSVGWGMFYNRLGGLYHIEGDRDSESLKWLEKAMARFILDKNTGGLYRTLPNITDIMFARGQYHRALDLVLNVSKKLPPENPVELLFYHYELSSHYMVLRQFKMAEQHLLEASRMEQEIENSFGPFYRTLITCQFGRFYFFQGQYAKSKTYFEKYLSDPSGRPGNLLQELYVYKLLIQIDSIFHDPVSGLGHYKKYTELLDSNFRVSKMRQAEELQVKYLTEEKENQIVVLNQKASLEQASLKQTKLIKNVTIAGIILVAIIATLLYRKNLIKQKNNIIITQKNVQLQHLVTEREWLLKEVHHRVKNNLQTIICLLDSQAIYLENDALQAIEKSQHRIYAMSLIHQKLYQNDDITSIDMSVYLEEFILYLKQSFDVHKIEFSLQIEPIHLNLPEAIPVGLIVNEAVTNSIKYAFNERHAGRISIAMAEREGIITLIIADNGKGFVPKDEDESKSLGIQLIRGLSKQINGSVLIEASIGTKVIIQFYKESLHSQQQIV
jgi:two-component sensor histidine kinase